MITTAKEFVDFSNTELMIQHAMRSLNLPACIYTHNQLQGPDHVETSVSFYSDDMSAEEYSLCGHFSQFVKDQGLNCMDKNHVLLARMVDDKLEISIGLHDD